jgi:hypothetical protein
MTTTGGSDASFLDTLLRIYSAQHQSMKAAAGAWTALAHAASEESSALSGTGTEAAGEEGVGLLELADRLQATSSWADGAGGVAQRIADQLNRSADRSAQATERAMTLEQEYVDTEEWRFERNASLPDGPAISQTNQYAEQEKERMRQEAQQELEALGSEFAQVIGGDAPAAPEGGAGSGAAPVAGGVDGGGSVGGGPGATGTTGAAAYADYEAPNGSAIGAGSYPYSSVLGPEHGDFAGWVQSPTTGYLVDPATGREFDPVAGRWIDPVTGQPFGEVTEYATRLSGLGAGPGAIASTGGLAGAAAVGGAVGGAAGLAGLYGGVMPPSVGHTGPARPQVMRQAVQNLGRRAAVASRFAQHEAAQGGRPFRPPPGASASRGPVRPGTARPGTARTPARTPLGRTPAGRTPLAPGGARPTAPPATGATGNGARRAGGTPARPGARALTEPARTWRVRTPDPAARHQLTPRPATTAPGPATGAARNGQARDERERRDGRPTELTEDPEVWSPRQNATRGVLGEQEQEQEQQKERSQ